MAGAHLLPAAEARWSADFLEEAVPSGTSEASRFSVYRAPGERRAFRYSDAGGASSIYDVAKEQQAELAYMSFSEFAQKKRACASGEDDGFAYYLWGVALRRAEAGGTYEGYNFGQTVDADLLRGPHWEALEGLRAAGGWGELKQAQIFVGCRDALTPCHYDLVHNVYAQVRGWKRFLLFDPCYADCLYPYPVAHPMDRCARADLEKPDYQRFPGLRAARAVEAIIGPGDALLLPAGWWHHVQTLTEDSISVSFWFDDNRAGRLSVGTAVPPGAAATAQLSALDRLLLAREVEQLLGKLLGPRQVRSALGQLRGMLGAADAPAPNPEEVLPCCFLLWRLALILGPGGARRFVMGGVADDRRFASLALKEEV